MKKNLMIAFATTLALMSTTALAATGQSSSIPAIKTTKAFVSTKSDENKSKTDIQKDKETDGNVEVMFVKSGTALDSNWLTQNALLTEKEKIDIEKFTKEFDVKFEKQMEEIEKQTAKMSEKELSEYYSTVRFPDYFDELVQNELISQEKMDKILEENRLEMIKLEKENINKSTTRYVDEKIISKDQKEKIDSFWTKEIEKMMSTESATMAIAITAPARAIDATDTINIYEATPKEGDSITIEIRTAFEDLVENKLITKEQANKMQKSDEKFYTQEAEATLIKMGK